MIVYTSSKKSMILNYVLDLASEREVYLLNLLPLFLFQLLQRLSVDFLLQVNFHQTAIQCFKHMAYFVT